MGFATVGFLGFLAAVALLYALVPRRSRCLLLVLVSYGFYWFWSRWFFALLLASTLLAFLAARTKSALYPSAYEPSRSGAMSCG